MKCISCGYNLTLEEPFCPHCGTKNDLMKIHEKEMNKFSQEFESTKTEVVENSKKFNSFVARIMVIAILVALIILTIYASDNSYEIVTWRYRREAAKNLDEHLNQLNALEQSEDLSALYLYYDENKLVYVRDDRVEEYAAVANASRAYNHFMNYVPNLLTCSQENSYETPEQIIDNMSTQINYIAELEKSYSYHPDYISDQHGEFIGKVKKDISDVCQVYIGLSKEEADSLFEISEARRTIMLEEGFENAKK